MNNVFVYGTLLNAEVLKIILNYVPAKRSARLASYKRVSVLGEKYPAIRPDESSEVEGALLTSLTDSDVRHLDRYEGEYYERVSVVVSMENDERQDCTAYIFKPEYYHLLSNETWTNERFRELHLQQFLRELASA